MKRLRLFAFAIGFVLIFQLTTPAVARHGAWNREQTRLADNWHTPEFQISPSTTPESLRYAPRVAYNWDQHEYLVVWHNYWAPTGYDIYARRVGSGGQILSWFCVATGAGGDNKKRLGPALTYNSAAKEYLVVYMYDASNDGIHWEVWGRRVAWNGSWLGPEFQIFSWGNRSFENPQVAWNSYRNEYLVIAEAVDTTNGHYNDVAGRRVMADGSTPYPGHNISRQDQTLQPQGAVVAYNVAIDEYLVVWAQYASEGNRDIYGARVRGDNDQVVAPGEFYIDTAGGDQRSPAVATNQQDRYLVVWELDVGGAETDWDIYGTEMNIFGNRVGYSIPMAYTPEDENQPAVTINGATNERFVIWRRIDATDGYETWGFSWYPPAEPTSWQPFRIETDAGSSEADVAAGAGYLVVYEDDISLALHICGKLYWQTALFLPLMRR
jgi:hypothetical protein